MPSPFPGMDPYLEGSEWLSFHTLFAAEIVRSLAPKLRPKYIALPTKRFVLEELEEIGIETAAFLPDVGIAVQKPTRADTAAIAYLTAPVEIATTMPIEVPQVSVEIRDVAGRELVTCIEILSPTNKLGRGREEYLAKRREILRSTAHLLEVDLLHAGKRIPLRKRPPSAPYYLFLSRAQRRPILEIWPVQLEESLPEIPIPLRGGDADVILDLQSVFTAAYESANYDLVLDYHQTPEAKLSAAEAKFAAKIAKAALK